jgi:hypothetical protein
MFGTHDQKVSFTGPWAAGADVDDAPVPLPEPPEQAAITPASNATPATLASLVDRIGPRFLSARPASAV